MNDDVLDPRMQKLVAALYGELSGEEEREFRKLLAEDPALRAEWEELEASRRVLAKLEAGEPAPGFVFLTDEPRAARSAPRGPWARVRGWFGAGPAWGLATAAVAVAALGLAEFRIQRVDGGVAFRFGEPQPEVTASAQPGTQEAAPDLSGILGADGAQVTPVSSGPPYLTRSDLDTYETQMLRLMRTMLQDYQSYRDQELAGVVRALYSDVNQRQDQVYDDLRGRIEALNVGLKVEQTESDLRYRDLLQNQARRLDDAPPNGPNDQQKEDHQ